MNRLYFATVGTFAFAASALIPISHSRKVDSGFFAKKQHRVVTITLTTPNVLTTCGVDFPVAVVSKAKHQTIAWAAEDNEFWVVFDDAAGPIGNKTIDVTKDNVTDDMPITPSVAPYYFKYAIYAVNPASMPTPTPCKASDDDHDTGLNVKP
jgi:hypothetical protein